jgi:hypothetical protein
MPHVSRPHHAAPSILLLIATVFLALRGSIAGAATDDADSLAASWSTPWNPPRALPPRQPWEQAVLLPGRIASLPLVGLGAGTRRLTEWLEAQDRIPIGPQGPRLKRARLVSLHLPKLGDRAGLGGAVQVRTPSVMGLLPTITARYTGTLRLYNSTQVGISRGPVALQYAYDWRPRDPIYGIGLSSSHDSLANFALQDELVRGVWIWSSADSSVLGPRLAAQAWGGPRSLVTRTGRDDAEASFDVLFPALAATTLNRQVEHLTYGVSLAADLREGRPHWSRGGRLRVAAERFDDPVHALALHSAQAGGATFDRYTIEAETGFSFLRDPRTLRLYARVVDDQVERRADRFLFADLARLGGRDGLSGFSPGRFRDLDALLARVTYVFPLARLFELEAHGEWGAVYPDVWRDAGFRSLKSSAGLSLRGRTDRSVGAALGVDVSRESVRLHYSLGGVE